MVEDRERLERFLARMCRMGFLHGDSQRVGYRARRANDLMKEVVKCETNVLCNIFAPVYVKLCRPYAVYNLHHSPHDLSLPVKDDRNFILSIQYKTLTIK